MGRIKLFSTSEEEEVNIVRGDGWKVLQEKISEAINEDWFLFILIIGERGKGKSTLALNILYNIYSSIEAVKKAIVFTPDDYDSLTQSKRYKELRAEDGRIKAIMWDDIGLHFSTYQWYTPHMRQRMIEFVENFQTVREDIAVLIGTVVEAEMLPPKLRSAANYMVDVYKRGKAKVFTYSRYLWLKRWKVIGEIEWTRCDQDLYTYYKMLKRRAHLAKEKSRIVSRTKIAEVYAKVLSSLNEIDVDLLYGLGIIDLHGNLTPFGEYVLKNSNLDIDSVLEVVRENESAK